MSGQHGQHDHKRFVAKDMAALLEDLEKGIHENMKTRLDSQMQQIEKVIEKVRVDILMQLRDENSREKRTLFRIPEQSQKKIGPEQVGQEKVTSSKTVSTYTEDLLQHNSDPHRRHRDREHAKQWQAHTLEYLNGLTRTTAYPALFHRTNCARWLGIDAHLKVPDTPLSRFVHGAVFEFLMVIAILAHCACIAIESESELQRAFRDPGGPREVVPLYVPLIFVVIFGIELVLRLYSDRKVFFFGTDYRWNLFTITLYVTICFDLLRDLDMHYFRHARFARFFVLYRFSRAVRVARLAKYFKGLRDVVVAMSWSASVLAWAFAMLCLVNLVSSLLFIQALSLHIADTSEVPNGAEKFFGSIETSMISLFAAVTGGLDWLDLEEPLQGTYARFPFYLWAAITILGIMNIIIGLFSQKALEASVADRSIATENQISSMTRLLSIGNYIFQEMDVDGCGAVTWEKFQDHLRKDDVKAYLLSQGLNVFDARALFILIDELDDDPSGEMDLDSFLLALMRLTGDAKSSDMFMILHECRKQTHVLSQIGQHLLGLCDVHFAKIETLVVNPSDSLNKLDARVEESRDSLVNPASVRHRL